MPWNRTVPWNRTTIAASALAVAVLALVAVWVARSGPDDAAGSEELETVELGTGLAGVYGPPAEQKRGSREVGSGEASFYHSSLEGKPTASGEPYEGAKLTAAHRTLPFGSRVRVTNLSNGRSVIVRINDRGPFARRRVIDLSRTAAEQLGMVNRGRARVRLELIE